MLDSGVGASDTFGTERNQCIQLFEIGWKRDVRYSRAFGGIEDRPSKSIQMKRSGGFRVEMGV